MDNVSESSDEERSVDLFQEPEGYYAPKKPFTFATYECKDGTFLQLRLVGHSPLWGHLLWNAGRVIAKYLEDNASSLARGKTVLELGAGAGLPGLVCASLGASRVVMTDYPESELIENLKYNIEHCGKSLDRSTVTAQEYLWGNSVTPLLAHLPKDDTGFDLLILADILFNHSEHAKLVRTVQQALRNDSQARALVFFTPYRPWLLEKDLGFFDLATAAGFEVTKLFEHVMDKVMFDEDPGDELLRRTVFAYDIRLS